VTIGREGVQGDRTKWEEGDELEWTVGGRKREGKEEGRMR